MGHPLLKYKSKSKPDQEKVDQNDQDENEIRSLIKRRRLQMLYHSFIYYHLDTNVISDDLWQAWADQLAQLQKDYPHLCEIDVYDYEFRDWTGATGSHLPANGIIRGMATYIIELNDKYSNQINDLPNI
jgi:hypothetical protein